MKNFHMIPNRDSGNKCLVTNFAAQLLVLYIFVNTVDMVVSVFPVLKLFETKRANGIPLEDFVLNNPCNHFKEVLFGHV